MGATRSAGWSDAGWRWRWPGAASGCPAPSPIRCGAALGDLPAVVRQVPATLEERFFELARKGCAHEPGPSRPAAAGR